MIYKKSLTNYWFIVEPYVYTKINNTSALLYNTLDGEIIESNKSEVIELLREMLKKENCGVVLLKHNKFEQNDINGFIKELRKKYMGDVIDVTLSKGKPVQLLPLFNFFETHEMYKRPLFYASKNILENLSEISIHVDRSTELTKLILFLQSIQGNPTFYIIGNIWDVGKYRELLEYFNQFHFPKYISSSYQHIRSMQPKYENNISYKISVHFPMDIQQWNYSRQILIDQNLPFEYIFDVTSEEDCQQVEQLVEQFQIEKYQLNLVYTGKNIGFFEDHVFLTKKDILSTSMTIKDFFSRQAMNIYDFGKINIMPNGDAHANVNHPKLGNIYTHSIYEIVHKEIEEGKSWFNIRNQAPCNNCVYQWLCPPPSNYEILIARPNLCHVIQ